MFKKKKKKKIEWNEKSNSEIINIIILNFDINFK